MIVGHGDIASVLKDREDRIYFASGVSNSLETRESEYEREKSLLLQQDKNKHLVYFGSLCIYYNDSRYTRHKLEMEELIKKHFSKYTIIRIGLITWGQNPNTLINFFRNKIKKREPLEVRDVVRYIVDKDEFLHWVGKIPSFNCEMNITGRIMTVKEIIKEYCVTALYE
jgi:nucleoside-diphosphate-sugar epimerase